MKRISNIALKIPSVLHVHFLSIKEPHFKSNNILQKHQTYLLNLSFSNSINSIENWHYTTTRWIAARDDATRKMNAASWQFSRYQSQDESHRDGNDQNQHDIHQRCHYVRRRSILGGPRIGTGPNCYNNIVARRRELEADIGTTSSAPKFKVKIQFNSIQFKNTETQIIIEAFKEVELMKQSWFKSWIHLACSILNKSG